MQSAHADLQCGTSSSEYALALLEELAMLSYSAQQACIDNQASEALTILEQRQQVLAELERFAAQTGLNFQEAPFADRCRHLQAQDKTTLQLLAAATERLSRALSGVRKKHRTTVAYAKCREGARLRHVDLRG